MKRNIKINWKSQKNFIIEEKKGITLMALVITVIVLLILAGIGLTMLTGDNSVLKRSARAKIETERTQVEEAAQLAYMKSTRVEYDEDDTVEQKMDITNALTREGYTTKLISTGVQVLSGFKLQVNGQDVTDVDFDVTGGSNTPKTIKVIPLTTEGTGTNCYVKINGLWHLLEVNTKAEKVTISKNGVADVTGGEIDLSGKVSATVASTDVATIPSSISEDTIKITPVEKGNTTISVSVKGIADPVVANISVTKLSKELKEINVGTTKGTTLYLDGASLITATLKDDTIATSSDVTWTSSNPNVATVTSSGIVKAGTQTGTATITCTGSNSTSETCTVISTASIVCTNSGAKNETYKKLSGGEETSNFAYNNPVLPVGFSAVNTNDAKWTNLDTDYNKGLVIMDARGNQFVWVPVDNMGTDNTARNSTTDVAYLKWCTKGDNSSTSEDSLPTGVSSENTQISKYGGFYVGRYESGLNVNYGTRSQEHPAERDFIRKDPVIVEGAIPWNYINYNNAKANAEAMYSNNNVKSGLITGTQWDTVMKFFRNVGGKTGTDDNIETSSTNWGNHRESDLTLDRYKMYSTGEGAYWSENSKKEAGITGLLRTGASTQTKVLNISDMAGNLWEMTTETYGDDIIYRSGFCGWNYYPAGYRLLHGVVGGNYHGFRVVLYVK